MAVEVVERKKGSRYCGTCNTSLDAGESECPKDAGHPIKKSLIVVRKSVADDADELPDDDGSDVDEDIEELEAELEDEDDEEDDDDEDDDDEDEDEADDEEDEDDEDEESSELPSDEEVKPLGKVAKGNMRVEVTNIATALAEKIVKNFAGKGKVSSGYETIMTEFNGVMDNAAAKYMGGNSISKGDSKKQAALVTKRVALIMKGEGDVPKKIKRPKELDGLELPDEVTAYIASLEGETEVEKSDDIYKGLTPEVKEIVKKAAKTNEDRTQQEFMDIAKSLGNLPGDRDELAKSLRQAAETSPKAYKTLLDTLTAANENLAQSDIFKSYGRPGAGSNPDSAQEKQIKDLIAKNDGMTREQAMVSLMGGKDYKPTNSGQSA